MFHRSIAVIWPAILLGYDGKDYLALDTGGDPILLDGLEHVTEYELAADPGGGRELALTMVRSVGYLSRNRNADFGSFV